MPDKKTTDLTVAGTLDLTELVAIVQGGTSVKATLSSILTQAINTQTVSYTLVLSDRNNIVEMNVASANNLTVPPNSLVAFPIGSRVDIAQYGAGQTTVVAGSGVTIRATPGLKLAAQYAGATLYKRATDEWVLLGNLST